MELLKVEKKLRTMLELGNFTLSGDGDFTQLMMIYLDNPRISVLGLQEFALKYLPIKPIKHVDSRQILSAYIAWLDLTKSRLSEYAMTYYTDLSLRVKLNEVVFNKTWFYFMFAFLVRDISAEDYLELNGWEEFFLLWAQMNDRPSTPEKPLLLKLPERKDMKKLQEYYLKTKLGVKGISNLYSSLGEATLDGKRMEWRCLSKEELSEIVKYYERYSHWGKEKYLKVLKDEYGV